MTLSSSSLPFILSLSVLTGGCAAGIGDPHGMPPSGDRPMTIGMTGDAGTPDDFGDAATGPDSGSSNEDCASEEYEAMEAVRPADIIFAVDSSGSMRGEAREVQNQMNRFASEILDSDVDPRVVVITESSYVSVPPPLGTDPEHYRLLNHWVGSHNALSRILQMFPMYSDFLRPNAVTHIVVVTDDESDYPGDRFRFELERLLDHEFVFHAIASPRPTCPGAAAPGNIYYNLASETGGVTHSICTSDWGMVFDTLATSVTEGASLPCTLAIPEVPADVEWDPMRVNVDYHPGNGDPATTLPFVGDAISCGSAGGWYYDHPVEMTEILLCPSSCEGVGADTEGRLQVRVGCETLLI